MGTEVIAILRRKLDVNELEELPTALTAHFQKQVPHIRFRRLVWSGEVVKQGGAFCWDPNVYDEELQRDDFEREAIRHFNQEWLWGWGKNELDGVRHITGPFALDLYIGSHSAYLQTDVHWEYFVFQKVFQTDFRRITRVVSDVLGSPFAIYLPDDVKPWDLARDYVAEGMNVSEIRDWLITTGAPANRFEELVNPDTCEAAGYFVDNFEGLT